MQVIFAPTSCLSSAISTSLINLFSSFTLYNSSCSDLNRRPHFTGNCLQGHIYQKLGSPYERRQQSCTRARGRNDGKPDRKEDATPCIMFCLRLLMRSAQAMSLTLFAFPRLPIKPFLLIPQCSDLQSKFKSALIQQARTLS